jgi:hypothetical protein
MERIRRRSVDGSACQGANETSSEEDRKDAEVLGGVVQGDTFVTRSEGVLDERAEVVWQWHVLGRCANAGDDKKGRREVPAGILTQRVGERQQCPDHEWIWKSGCRRSALRARGRPESSNK